MCVSVGLMAAGLAVSGAAGGLFSSIQAANAKKKNAKWEAAMRNRQAFREREMQRIGSMQQENARASEFEAARSSAMAAIGASGLGEHISFFQSIDPQAQKAFLRDVRTIRLNMTNAEAGVADQVQVTERKKDIEVFNAKQSKIGAIADFIQTAMQAVSMGMGGMTGSPAGAGGGAAASDAGAMSRGAF